MSLIGVHQYGPKWISELGKCVDRNNSELKDKYGEPGVRICCEHICFITRQSLLQYFKSQRHQTKMFES